MNTLQQQEIQQFSHLELLARQVVEGFITGLHKSPFHGFSVEFAEHRLYNSGEPTKHIDWKLYGRTDRMFVKRYEEETNLRCQIVIDHSSSMYYPAPDQLKAGQDSKITFAVKCAAAMIELLKTQRDAVGLSVFSDKTELHTAAKSGSVHHKMLYHELEKLLQIPTAEQRHTTQAVQALHEVADKTHRRSLIVIFSDMFDSGTESDELFSALQHLRHNKHEVVLFHVTDRQSEIEFDFDNKPYTFVDVETGEEVKAHPAEVREVYLKSIRKFSNELKLRCAQFRIDYIEADVRAGFHQVLMPYLVKRSKMI